ncbi:carboxy-S-adenosyl-L-methionine synthase CmoA [Pseudoalteromonas sp. MMG013]|uniref:carboxy-S-adenosyl-L-methionine synthase CmoA n=1 Tax=unclassified Pseudoalteromonas TaxID=194690 RepID=UPI001B3780B1|nr:carboxy-S-adenosyl-L-methionine synthase CmoA [Pseudoalteromonas sp. MMG012]MBQ4846957.1 carboxy-S-adenosyl-L-methionine synthase CmoA [Pseudoalteromonas sp. MMG005]MBQ4852506.1 carboxy-S-adenosyl-L-methionine synthase CmoA [Pseudoalteromonas sp. MMG012]MBQ4862793.1 carboxy-S-adenosyl-L-methionine synthase CmoA [Pseudoalteromonas sp. MMG013]
MTGKDSIYATEQQIKDFSFDENVVEVFPDMIQRSVPGYATIVSTMGKLAGQYAQSNSNLYDLGCSLGAVTLSMRRNIEKQNCQIIAVDNSKAMVERCQLHLKGFKSDVPVNVVLGDITELTLENASVIALNFTLQFIPQEQREAVLKHIYASLKPGGVLLLSEKVKGENDLTDNLLIDLHHDFKRHNGYSELEISQKRTAIENVMRPDPLSTHIERLHNIGFSQTQVWYQCFNFCSLVAIK